VRGFSLVELVVVLLVMAVLGAVALPRLTDRRALQERGARDQLRGLILQARKVALTQQREVCVLLTAAGAAAVYAPGGACSPGQPVLDPSGDGNLRMDMPVGMALAAAQPLRFDTRGRPVAATDRVVAVGTLSLTVYRETGLAQ